MEITCYFFFFRLIIDKRFYKNIRLNSFPFPFNFFHPNKAIHHLNLPTQMSTPLIKYIHMKICRHTYVLRIQILLHSYYMA